MRYTRHVRKSLCNAPPFVWGQLREDFRFAEKECAYGVSWDTAMRKMVVRMWLGEIGVFTFWGGSKIVRVDTDPHFLGTDENWRQGIRIAYENTVQRTNRKIWGRRWFRKIPSPTSLVFFEKAKLTNGRHIHALFHFPPVLVDSADEYLQMFQKVWFDHKENNQVGRTFWYQPVEDQDEVSRYATKQITNNYEDGWFAI